MADRRIAAALADAGVASRRASEDLIRAGRVTVDGRVVTDLATRIAPGQALGFDGAPVGAEPLEHWLVNKPPGVLSAVRDARFTGQLVADLVPSRRRLYPVGRLDLDSGGLILLTNDGALAQRLMHPSREVPKVYRLEVDGEVTTATVDRLAAGIELDDGPTAPAEVRLQRASPSGSVLLVTLHEGRKRQLRRMLDAVGHRVRTLLRVHYAGLTMRGLDRGAARRLTAREVAALRELVGLPVADGQRRAQ